MAKGTQTLVVACDGSDHSVHAAEMAADLAKASGQDLKLLAVFPGTRVEKLVISGVWPSELEEEAQDWGRKAFDAARNAVESKVKPTEEVLLKGDPAKEIIDYLEENPGTHMFLGRRGHSMVRSLTLGSISEKVIRHAHGPVTVVSD